VYAHPQRYARMGRPQQLHPDLHRCMSRRALLTPFSSLP
jgi:hypothetical protein